MAQALLIKPAFGQKSLSAGRNGEAILFNRVEQ
jgi:hypothetical protein